MTAASELTTRSARQLLFCFSERRKSLIIGDLPFAAHCAAEAIIFFRRISGKYYFPLQMENKGAEAKAMSHQGTKTDALWPQTLSSWISCAFGMAFFKKNK